MLTETKPGALDVDVVDAEIDRFLDEAGQAAAAHPWLVAITMHEHFRSLYPADPHLPWAAERPLARVARGLQTGRRLLQAAGGLGSYFAHGAAWDDALDRTRFDPAQRRPAEPPTQQVYGRLWDELERRNYLNESAELLDARLGPAGLSAGDLRGLDVLDLGCGSGRFTLALAAGGARSAHGVDLGTASMARARDIAGSAVMANVTFRTGDALSLPYPEGAFDFVWCNGVLHHTADMEQGVRELARVLRPGGRSFLYLYAAGGLFWTSRRRMRPVMQRIPQEYTMRALELIGMPRDRFIFTDSWYVPRERHAARAEVEAMFADAGFASWRKVIGTRTTDLDRALAEEQPDGPAMWGDGEHRYLLER